MQQGGAAPLFLSVDVTLAWRRGSALGKPLSSCYRSTFRPSIRGASSSPGSERGARLPSGLVPGAGACAAADACAALVLRGEHDFCTEACVAGWAGLRDCRFVTLEGASHHALLEAPEEYLRLLGAFLAEHDGRRGA